MYQPDQRQQNFIICGLIGLLLGVATLPFVIRQPMTTNEPSIVKRVQPKCLRKNEILFTPEELAQHTQLPSILLGFMGVVYNVSDGHYYHPGGSYSFFAGRDGTRAFLTGEFDTVDELRDDISDLDGSYMNGMETWIKLYDDKYPRVGLVIGSYYDNDGCATKKLHRVKRMLSKSATNKQLETEELNQYPPCNSHWDAQTNLGRVWCTKLSGGIQRYWTGKPRLFYDLFQKKWRCACVNNEDEQSIDYCDQQQNHSSIGMQYDDDDQNDQNDDDVKLATPGCRFKHYENCDPKSLECSITS
ncbi:neuferricin [Dermatophagoides farinae]|uniref:Neuferricin n=1 Tax=Dermatophagoides farinae TaxID=6954 RepID=A0A922HWR7_DERFA|nr:Neuferricin [Dermatophagoides farinae]